MKLIIPNIPNTLTLFRVALIPVFVWSFFRYDPLISLVIYWVAFVTDILDGWIARSTNTITSFGKLADPIADKVMTITAIACLTTEKGLPLCFLIFYIAKEFLVVSGNLLVYMNKKEICGARWPGKIAMGVTFFTITFLFFGNEVILWRTVIMWTAVIINTLAAIYYARIALTVKR